MSKPDISRARLVKIPKHGAWPAVPAIFDDYEDNLTWRIHHEPERLTGSDRDYIRLIVNAYFTLIESPRRHRDAIVRELRAEQAAVRQALDAWPDEETGEWMTPEDLR